jgi:hypothetical protein
MYQIVIITFIPYRIVAWILPFKKSLNDVDQQNPIFEEISDTRIHLKRTIDGLFDSITATFYKKEVDKTT